MPFTPSHAVVALPFVRTPLVPAAVAVGAMTPDLPLFTRGMVVDYRLTHDPRWLPATALIALVLLLVWRVLLRPACLLLAPRVLGERVPAEWDRGPAATLRETFGSVGRTALLLVSLVLGAASHILWDDFTHEGRLGVEVFPVLGESWGPLPGYRWLQHGSSLVALVVLGVAGALWLRGRAPRPVQPAPAVVRVSWWLSLPAVLVIAVLVGLAVYGPLTQAFTVQHLAYRTLPLACGVWAGLTLVLVVVLRLHGALADRARPRRSERKLPVNTGDTPGGPR